jgi:hypothetical protein
MHQIFQGKEFREGEQDIPLGQVYFIKEERVLMMSNIEMYVSGSSERKSSIEPKLTKIEKNSYFEVLLGCCKEIGDAIQPPADSMNKMHENTIFLEEDMVCLTLLALDF